ncbi:succinate--CoA ligase subunit beta [Nostoc sp. FACHB-87]|uniref:succinate--CoA ligase subunit beta n=1 Tax=Nostocales TaxID=1161 RepID=UPI0016841CE3|nr:MULTISPECIES: succinate--CoA ligase subunit beta [Nostocales]MBD2298569.1 succinate--CoA ligase subunit beta [Nostoc sp. FACHB-190]MBD2455882.1 succinate--CoA ligase subunit beta [Nostoc sp. FACHB-87]MBD2474466.1 succinate--CoA ligase subunit beta [Anabaena sp. FACHB-83]MBD2486990.1 succinate--CoA ligase subunit beta [Aulosira sp. FACHB-615]
MDLLEYQVKEWFGNIGIPVLPSQRIDHPTDLKRLKIRYPVVLKSQVYAGERIHAGGVRIVETTIDAIAAAQTIFNLPIWGELPEVLLAETKYDSKQEFYLAVVLDTAVCRPVLLGCKEANIDWESAGEKLQYVVVEQEFSPFYARRLALKMGLQGALMQSVSSVVEKMYELFIQKDLDLVEINPLAVNAANEVMALNGKVSINERAIGRHPELAELAAKISHRHSSQKNHSKLKDLNGGDTQGKIGILGNGAGSIMATFDLVASLGGKPSHPLNLRHGLLTDTSPTSFGDRLNKGLNLLAADKSIQVILINLLGSIPQAEAAAQVIAKFIQDYQSQNRRESHIPHLVVRLAGSELNVAQDLLAGVENQGELVLVEDLDEAVAQAVRLAKPVTYQRVKVK